MDEIEEAHDDVLSAFWDMVQVYERSDLPMEKFMQRVAVKAQMDIQNHPNDMETQRKAHIRLAAVNMSMAAACTEDIDE